MKKTYRASCHCNRVVIEAELDLSEPSFRCNCSICRRTRFWPAIVRPDGFRIVSGENDLTKYEFCSKKNHHFFCKHCGVRVFGKGNETPIGVMYGVNLGCVEGVSEEALAQVPVVYVDGMHDRWSEAPTITSHL
jgi:hypothetical protein